MVFKRAAYQPIFFGRSHIHEQKISKLQSHSFITVFLCIFTALVDLVNMQIYK